MGKRIRNDNELAGLLESFLKRLSSRFDQSTPTGKYFAHITHSLSEQRTSFFASLAVKSYGQLKTPVQNNLPSYLNADKIISTVLQSADARREATSYINREMTKIVPSATIQQILAPNRAVSHYGILLSDNIERTIGKRHPFKIAQDAMHHAAKLNSDELYEIALHALECYILIDTSIFEVYKRIADCYDELWNDSKEPASDNLCSIFAISDDSRVEFEDNTWGGAPCSLQELCDKFDPYGKKAHNELDYRYREALITSELIVNVVNLL